MLFIEVLPLSSRATHAYVHTIFTPHGDFFAPSVQIDQVPAPRKVLGLRMFALLAVAAASAADGASLTADIGKFAWLAGHTHGMARSSRSNERKRLLLLMLSPVTPPPSPLPAAAAGIAPSTRLSRIALPHLMRHFPDLRKSGRSLKRVPIRRLHPSKRQLLRKFSGDQRQGRWRAGWKPFRKRKARRELL